MIFLDCIFFLVFHSGLVFFFPDWGEGEGSLLSPLIPLSKISPAMEGLMIDGALTTESVFVCFLGQISPNFDLKNMVSTYTKDFNKLKMLHGQKIAEIRQIFTQKNFQIARIL